MSQDLNGFVVNGGLASLLETPKLSMKNYYFSNPLDTSVETCCPLTEMCVISDALVFCLFHFSHMPLSSPAVPNQTPSPWRQVILSRKPCLESLQRRGSCGLALWLGNCFSSMDFNCPVSNESPANSSHELKQKSLSTRRWDLALTCRTRTIRPPVWIMHSQDWYIFWTSSNQPRKAFFKWVIFCVCVAQRTFIIHTATQRERVQDRQVLASYQATSERLSWY